MKKLYVQKIIFYILALCYAFFLSILPNDIFRDRSGYVIYAEEANLYLINAYNYGVISFLFSEPIFLIISHVIGLIIGVNLVPIFFVFVSGFIYFYSVLKESSDALSRLLVCVLIFSSPGFIHLQNVVLRQGFATAILLLVCISTSDRKKWLVTCFVLGFIHNSFFLIGFLIFFDYILSIFNIKDIFKYFIFLVSFFTFGLFSNFLFSSIEFKQSNFIVMSDMSVSGFAFALWLGVLFLIIFRIKKYNIKYDVDTIAIVGLIFYLSMYFLSPIGGRVILSFLPFIFLSIVKNLDRITLLFILLFLFVNLTIFRTVISANSLNSPLLSFF